MNIDKQNVANIYPLTPLQEGFLFHALSNQDDSYIQQIAYLLKGRFDQERFSQVWAKLFERHEILRGLFFHTGAERPLQVILKKQLPVFDSIDLRHLPEQEQLQRRQQIKSRDRKRGFRLNQDCLMRFTLLQLADDLTEVIWTHHHIILDGWSLGILLSECTALYQDINTELAYTVPFSNYVKWLEKKDKQQALDFWQSYLADYQDEVKLPFTSEYQSSESERIRASFTLPESTFKGIQQLTRDVQVSLNSILHGAWALLLAHYNGCEDVVFGTTVSGRPADIEHVEQIVGLFINTIPVRVSLAPTLTVRELLAQIQDRAIQAEPHHYSPLSTIQAQHPLQNRLISTHVTLENFPLDERFKKMSEADEADLSVQANEVVERTHYPLDIQFLPAEHGIKVQMAYSSDYQADMHQFIQAHLCQILLQMTQNPELELSKISLMDDQTRQKIIEQTESALKQFPFDPLLRRFDLAAAAAPNAIALVYEDQQLTYAELNGYANDVCRCLYAGGLKAEDFVGLCFERSIEMVIAILGVLKAGMVYVPMDPSLPEQRMRFMAEDSGIKMLLTSPDKVVKLAAVAPQLQAVSLSELSCIASNSSVSNWQVRPDSPAYVIYTSGSTGQPKGVLVSHGNMAGLFSGTDTLFDFNADDVWCLFHSYAFDFSVWEIWGALAYGGRLVIVPYWISRSPEDFHALLKKERVTVLNQTPTAFKQLIDTDRQNDVKLNDLRYVIFGGEALEFKQLKPWFEAYGERPQLVNMYGITETTVHVTFKKIKPEQAGLQCSLIGKPLPHLSVYVLDRYGRLVAPGVPGELYVGGAGVCLGYLNRPELSAQRFVHLPQLHLDTLFYRTGDCGRYLNNGELDYLCRLDQQVQFHGFRIELGEIEQAMLRQPLIEQAVVMMLENAQSQQILVAYYSTRTAEAIKTADLRAPLAKLLPLYMIPGFFVHLPQFPLTANGKVNRQALPAPELELDEPFLEANTPEEQVLVEVWQKLLQQSSVGVKDDFFALGGDSIQAIRVVSQLRKQGYRIEVQDLFRYPTIQALAPQLKALAGQKKTRSVSGDIQLTPVQHWFFEQQGQQAHHFNHTALLEARSGNWQVQYLERSWNQLLQHHEALRSCFYVNEHGVKAAILPEDQLQIEIETVSLMAAVDVEAAMIEHAALLQQGFVLDKAPLIRLVVYQCPSADRLLIVVHHLLIDGVSWRILLEDFSALYDALSNGDQYALPEQTDSYADWAEGLLGYSRQQSLLNELPYWTAQVERNSGAAWAGKHCRYQDADNSQAQLSTEETQQLLQQANAAYNTSVEELLLAALIPALESWAGLTRSVLLLEGHGREPVLTGLDVSRTVGWFTSLYPFVLDKTVGRDLGYQIKTVKEHLRQLPNKGIGYGVLRYLTPAELRAGAGLGFEPDLVFNYLGRFDRSDEAGLYQALSNDVGAAVSAQGLRPCALELSAMVLSDQLCIDWRYDRHLFTPESMQSLTNLYTANLREVINHCLQQTTQAITPSDLTYSDLSLDELDDFFTAHRENLSDVCPLTPMQQGMQYHALRETDSTAYHEQISFTLQGELDTACYRKAWDKLVSRHGILRTVFVDNKTQDALQVVLKQVDSVFGIEDWSTSPNTLEHYLQADLADRFKLAERPPVRIKLIKLAEQRWHLVWSFHHILLDGWSVGVLMDEMAQLYQAILKNSEPRLPASPPFSHYLQWLKQQDSQAASRFWQDYLDGYSELASLPHYAGQQAKQAEFKQPLPIDLPDRLQQAAKHYKVTVNALIQAAWGILLGRYNDRRDVVFATVVSGRPSAIVNIDRMVGLLINAVPVRVSFAESELVSDLLTRLHQHNSDSQAYQFLPMAESQPKQGAPDHLLVFENYHLQTSDEDNQGQLAVTDVQTREQTNYDLTMVISPGQRWQLTCLYNQVRYADHYIQQVAQHFITLLSGLASQADQSIDSLAMLNFEEQAQLMQRSVGATQALPEQDLAGLFEQIVQYYGEQIALRGEEASYNYAELNVQANRLAHRLVSGGVKPGDIVAIALPRCCMRIIAVLAVIKAGAAYLGLEFDTPAQRVQGLCEDAGVRLLIQQGAFDLTGVTSFDPYLEIQQATSEDNLQLAVPSSAIAYISYTSGSTGEPKGVCVSQHNVIRLVINSDFVSISAEDRFLHFAPLSFDASTLEIWAPLLNGAGLSVIEQPQPSLQQLGTFINQHSISILWLTAGLFQQMVDEQLEDLAGVKQLLAGGDVVSAEHVRRLLNRFPDTVFINGYGPTENTTFSCCQHVTKDMPLAASVPIGKAITNSEAWVLDKQLRLQPVGAIGQLYVAGAGVSYGYCRKPKQTAAVFIPHPYTKEPGKRLYCTGDQVSLRADGSIEFMGRVDQQFKIRGYRVEAQEVEAAIKAHDSVQDVLVQVVKDAAGDKALAAYVIVKQGRSFDQDELVAETASRLPRYLMPDLWLEINAFPLNKNGKVNRALLPDPFSGLAQTQKVAPRNEREQALLAIWQQVLNIEHIGVTDDFFRLGGHSLKATQIVSLMRKQLGLEVPLKLIFEAPTIALLAERMQGLDKVDKAAPKLVKRDRSQQKVV
ncbi:non-ribosomal peptide synthetase [Methylobacter sp.]|uniref:non-ribosomal peptide synthetase n=1 Tax=Methylobacter sp. TaxID=2051955 RepID=UPI00121C33E2|nr:non-ribosomal peptide synthetase [Methylobacter sp.]TAK60287.1 MAG: amino acid adenylation domain-containing protein [Methylobacter sp.]